MNNKGFTLVELLATIILIGLLIGIGVPGISRISKNMKEKSLNTKTDLLEQHAVLWGQDNKALLQTDNDCEIDNDKYNCKKLSIYNLIEEGYLDSESYNEVIYTNPVNDKNLANKDICVECNIHIYKKNNRVYAYFGDKSCSSCID